MNKNTILVTFFTSTYNRPNKLYRCFERFNLLEQKFSYFEWIIVDDGSTDSQIVPILEKIQNEAKFSIKVVRKKNQGKSYAINDGALLARGDWFCIVDDDDYVDSNILSIFQKDLQQFDENCVGIAYRKKFLDNSLVGKNIISEKPFLKMKPNKAGELFKGDLAYFFKTSVLQKCPFPQHVGVKFIPELYVWNKISDHGEIFYNNAVAIYFCEYLDDGLSQNFKKNLKRNPKGFLVYYIDQVKRAHSFAFLAKNLIRALQCFFYLKIRN